MRPYLTKHPLVLIVLLVLTTCLGLAYLRLPPNSPPKKLTQDLLIGTWIETKSENSPQSAKVKTVFTFTTEGIIIGKLEGSRHPRPEKRGKYTLDGDVLRFVWEEGVEDSFEQGERILTIESISDDALILLGPEAQNRERITFNRSH